MKKRISIVLLSLLLVFPAFAQDVTDEAPTPSPELTEVVSLPPVATADSPVVVVNNPVQPATDNTSALPHFLLEAGLSLAVVFLALKQSKLIPPETVDKVLERFFQLVKGVTATTETKLDDEFVGVTEEVVRKLIQQELQKQLNEVVTASKNSAAVG